MGDPKSAIGGETLDEEVSVPLKIHEVSPQIQDELPDKFSSPSSPKEEPKSKENPKSALRTPKYGVNKSRKKLEKDDKADITSPLMLCEGTLVSPTKINLEFMRSQEKNDTGSLSLQEATVEQYNSLQFAKPTRFDVSPRMTPTSTKTTTTTKKIKKLSVSSQGYGKSGLILSRTAKYPLLFQKWSQSYWLHVHPATIHIFDSKEKMQKWKKLYDVDMKLNKHGNDKRFQGIDDLSKKELKKLVKASINFDTTGELKKIVKEAENIKNGTVECNTSVINTYSRSKVGDCNGSEPLRYHLEEVRSKYYSRGADLMHTFKISYFSAVGRNICAAFGSTESSEVKRLRAVIRRIVNLTRKANKKSKGIIKRIKTTYGSSSVVTSMTGMYTTQSEVTALSNTVYGKRTMTDRAVNQHHKSKRRVH